MQNVSDWFPTDTLEQAMVYVALKEIEYIRRKSVKEHGKLSKNDAKVIGTIAGTAYVLMEYPIGHVEKGADSVVADVLQLLYIRLVRADYGQFNDEVLGRATALIKSR